MTTNPLTAPISPATIATEPTLIHDAAFIAHTLATLTADFWQAAPSKAPSARYGRPCPTCKATADQPCRTLTTGRVTDTHVARIRGAG